MNDEELKRLLKENAEETRRQMDARFDAVDGRLDGMDARFDGVDARFDRMDARFDGVDARFDRMDARFDGVDARFEQMDARLDRTDASVAARFDAMDARFDTIDARFDRTDASVAERFDTIDARFDRTDASVAERFTELHRYLDVIAEDLIGKLELGRELLLMEDEKLHRNIATVEGEMKQGFADTHAQIAFLGEQHRQANPSPATPAPGQPPSPA
jgi:hypothetical protein